MTPWRTLLGFTATLAALSTGTMGFASPSPLPPMYRVTDLGSLGGRSTHPRAISENGLVTGDSLLSDETTQRAFLYDGAMHDLGTLGGANSIGVDVNSQGQVAGHAAAADGFYRAFLYDDVMTDLGTLGGVDSAGLGINEHGAVTGQARVSGNIRHPFLWDGVMHDLGSLGGEQSSGLRINDRGQVAGSSAINPQHDQHAFLYDGALRDLGTLGGSSSHGTALNEWGHVTGSSYIAGDGSQHAFVYDDAMRDIGTLGGDFAEGLGINRFGYVVGTSTLSTNEERAFYYEPTLGMIDLNSLIDPELGWTLSRAVDINDLGQIIAYASREQGRTYGVLLNRVPEPGRGWLAMTAAVTVIGASWQSSRTGSRRRALNSL